MPRVSLISLAFSLALLVACSTGAPPALSPQIENPSALPTTGMPAPEPSEAGPAVSAPTPGDAPAPEVYGLRVAYLKAGDLWVWDEGGAARQLTTGQSLSDLRVSPDGLRIAFTRGRELWAIQSDGGGERLLVPQSYLDALKATPDETIWVDSFGWFPGRETVYFSTWTESGEYPLPRYDLHLVEFNNPAPYAWLAAGQGGRLAFAPDGLKLTLSSHTSIDVLDLAAGTRLTVHSFPEIANYETGYLPQVIWSPDSSGFKTVVPPDAEDGVNLGPAQFLFIFPNGTVARLASFDLVPLYETLPAISPDGTYVIYAARSGGGSALYLMDSSGATRAYSEEDQQVRMYGWAPDARHFVYGLGNPARIFLGSVGSPAVDFPGTSPESVQWVDAAQFAALEDGSLVIRWLDGARVQLDTQVSRFELFR